MIIEYNVHCFERDLIIKFPDKYEHLKEEIIKMLDGFYFEWHDAENIEDPEKRVVVMDTCCEEYIMDRLSETYNMWEEWDTYYYGDNEEETVVRTIPVTNVVKNLIKAMSEYALENQWCDSEAIDALVECGITEQEFIACGYGDFVKDYFKED